MSDNNKKEKSTDCSKLQFPADSKAFSQAMLEENAFACNQQITLLDEIAESLSTIALYFQRKGESESIFHPDDLSGDDDEK